MSRIPESEWQWFGNAAHFICGRWCRFHMATLIGPWLVSTVGEYFPPHKSGDSERAENEYAKEHPLGEEIGYDRLFETYVFKAGPPCVADGCACGLPSLADACEIDSLAAKTRVEATTNHRAMCDKWAGVGADAS